MTVDISERATKNKDVIAKLSLDSTFKQLWKFKDPDSFQNTMELLKSLDVKIKVLFKFVKGLHIYPLAGQLTSSFPAILALLFAHIAFMPLGTFCAHDKLLWVYTYIVPTLPGTNHSLVNWYDCTSTVSQTHDLGLNGQHTKQLCYYICNKISCNFTP